MNLIVNLTFILSSLFTYSEPINILKMCKEYTVGESSFVASCKAINSEDCSEGVIISFENIGGSDITFSVFGINDESFGNGTSFSLTDEAIYRIEINAIDIKKVYYFELDIPNAGVAISPIIFLPREDK